MVSQIDYKFYISGIKQVFLNIICRHYLVMVSRLQALANLGNWLSFW